MKTPEQMAEEYERFNWCVNGLKSAFLAGYQAAKELYAAKLKEANDTIDGMVDECEGLKTIIYDNEQTNLPTPAKWISVKDRLPKKNILILCCSLKSLSPTYGWFDGAFWNVNDEPNYFKDKIDCISFITHWMPLPEAPKGGE